MYLYYAREKLLEHESHVQSKVLGIRIEGIEFGKIVHITNIKNVHIKNVHTICDTAGLYRRKNLFTA